MSTITIAQTLPYPDVVDFASPLLDAAANLETRVRNAELHAQSLARQLHWAEVHQARTERALKSLSHSHRTASHSKTSQLLKRIIADLTTRERS